MTQAGTIAAQDYYANLCCNAEVRPDEANVYDSAWPLRFWRASGGSVYLENQGTLAIRADDVADGANPWMSHAWVLGPDVYVSGVAIVCGDNPQFTGDLNPVKILDNIRTVTGGSGNGSVWKFHRLMTREQFLAYQAQGGIPFFTGNGVARTDANAWAHGENYFEQNTVTFQIWGYTSGKKNVEIADRLISDSVDTGNTVYLGDKKGKGRTLYFDALFRTVRDTYSLDVQLLNAKGEGFWSTWNGGFTNGRAGGDYEAYLGLGHGDPYMIGEAGDIYTYYTDPSKSGIAAVVNHYVYFYNVYTNEDDSDGSNTLIIPTTDLIANTTGDQVTITQIGQPAIGSATLTDDSIFVRIPSCSELSTYLLQGSLQVTIDTKLTDLGFSVGEPMPGFNGRSAGTVTATMTVNDVIDSFFQISDLGFDLEGTDVPEMSPYLETGYPTLRRDLIAFTPSEIASLDPRLWGTPRTLEHSPGPGSSIYRQVSLPITYSDFNGFTTNANVVISVTNCQSGGDSNGNTTPNTVTLHADDIHIDVCCEANSINPAIIAIQTILANAVGDGLTLTGLSTPLYGNAQITANGIVYQSPPCGSFPAPPLAVNDHVTIGVPSMIAAADDYYTGLGTTTYIAYALNAANDLRGLKTPLDTNYYYNDGDTVSLLGQDLLVVTDTSTIGDLLTAFNQNAAMQALGARMFLTDDSGYPVAPDDPLAVSAVYVAISKPTPFSDADLSTLTALMQTPIRQTTAAGAVNHVFSLTEFLTNDTGSNLRITAVGPCSNGGTVTLESDGVHYSSPAPGRVPAPTAFFNDQAGTASDPYPLYTIKYTTTEMPLGALLVMVVDCWNGGSGEPLPGWTLVAQDQNATARISGALYYRIIDADLQTALTTGGNILASRTAGMTFGLYPIVLPSGVSVGDVWLGGEVVCSSGPTFTRSAQTLPRRGASQVLYFVHGTKPHGDYTSLACHVVEQRYGWPGNARDQDFGGGYAPADSQGSLGANLEVPAGVVPLTTTLTYVDQVTWFNFSYALPTSGDTFPYTITDGTSTATATVHISMDEVIAPRIVAL
jgi:hypothetical protein